MALSADRKLDVREKVPVEFGYYVGAGFIVYRGSIVAIRADFTIVPAGSAGALVNVGIAERMQSNLPPTGFTSSLQAPMAVRCRRGSWQLPFDVVPVAANIGAAVYAIDDQTVSLSSNSGAHLQCGVLEGFDERFNPWVRM